MKVLLIDDEGLALRQLQMMLEKAGGVEVLGSYRDAGEGLEAVKRLRPQVVFLDIQMPGMDGLQIGMQIQEAVPEAEIVFVTAYDHYAVQAFDMHALDYVMKPLLQHRLYKTVQRVREKLKPGAAAANAGEPRLCLLQSIRAERPRQQFAPIKWRTAKARELFAYLLHHRGRPVGREIMLEMLWPDFDAPRASQQLYTTIYQIRRSLKQAGLGQLSIRSTELLEGYMLDAGTMQIDVEEWEHALQRLNPPDEQNMAEHEQALYGYTGDYLGEYDYVWAESERERLRRLWLDHGHRLTRFYDQKGWSDRALGVRLHIWQADPLCEENALELMRLYDRLNRPSAVEEQYRILIANLEKELDAAPGEKVTAWYEDWKRGREIG